MPKKIVIDSGDRLIVVILITQEDIDVYGDPSKICNKFRNKLQLNENDCLYIINEETREEYNCNQFKIPKCPNVSFGYLK